jgi:hypothetical protein
VKLTDFSIRNPLVVGGLAGALCLFGLVADLGQDGRRQHRADPRDGRQVLHGPGEQARDGRVHAGDLRLEQANLGQQVVDLQPGGAAEGGQPERILGGALQRQGLVGAGALAAGARERRDQLRQVDLREVGRGRGAGQERGGAGAGWVLELVGDLREDAVQHPERPALGVAQSGRPGPSGSGSGRAARASGRRARSRRARSWAAAARWPPARSRPAP